MCVSVCVCVFSFVFSLCNARVCSVFCYKFLSISILTTRGRAVCFHYAINICIADRILCSHNFSLLVIFTKFSVVLIFDMQFVIFCFHFVMSLTSVVGTGLYFFICYFTHFILHLCINCMICQLVR